jgi:tetratricopeptide (TPR) repeat protein
LLALLAAVIVGSQMWVRGEAREIRHELLSQPRPDLSALADRYQQAARVSLPGSGLAVVRDELHEALSTASNRILHSYHGDDPSTTERDWQEASEELRAASELDWRDSKSRARLYYCRAHLDRIAAQALRAKGQRLEATTKSREALAGFQEAARRDTAWPDPYLGVARVYAYDLFDLDKLQEALGELGRRGYPLGRREKAMLADGFRMRGRDFAARAVKARGQEEEQELLEQAKSDFEQAVEFYDEIPTYANVPANRADAQRQLDQMDARREEIFG